MSYQVPFEKLQSEGGNQPSTTGTAGSAGSDHGSNLNLSQPSARTAGGTAQEAGSASVQIQTSAQAAGAAAAAEREISNAVCQSEDATTVCADKVQPALLPQPWEQAEQKSNQDLTLQQCQLLNASVCEASVQLSKQGQGFLVVVYNALAWERPTEPVRVPIDVGDDAAVQWVVTGWHCLPAAVWLTSLQALAIVLTLWSLEVCFVAILACC